VLCLGNELLADDAFGFVVAERLRRTLPAGVEVVCSSESGFSLVERVTGCDTLIIVDSIRTGAVPGTIHVIELESRPGAPCGFAAGAADSAPADSPHRVGIMEVLKAAHALGLSVPRRVLIHAVEAADITTIGGSMDARVRNAIAIIVNQVTKRLGTSSAPVARVARAGRNAAAAITEPKR
jgi:hydrogenase maturation protease